MILFPLRHANAAASSALTSFWCTFRCLPSLSSPNRWQPKKGTPHPTDLPQLFPRITFHVNERTSKHLGHNTSNRFDSRRGTRGINLCRFKAEAVGEEGGKKTNPSLMNELLCGVMGPGSTRRHRRPNGRRRLTTRRQGREGKVRAAQGRGS